MQSWLRQTPAGVEVDVWVVPGSRRTEIVGTHGERLKVRVAAPPEEGKANRQVGRLLVTATGAQSVTLLGGATSRRKTYLLNGVDLAAARRALSSR